MNIGEERVDFVFFEILGMGRGCELVGVKVVVF